MWETEDKLGVGIPYKSEVMRKYLSKYHDDNNEIT